MLEIEMPYFEGSINDEKRQIYEKACQFIETLSNYIYICYVKIVFPLITVPYLLMSYFNYYYLTDLDKNAFSLPYVVWYVQHFSVKVNWKLSHFFLPS